jgi:hypothetical protein
MLRRPVVMAATMDQAGFIGVNLQGAADGIYTGQQASAGGS